MNGVEVVGGVSDKDVGSDEKLLLILEYLGFGLAVPFSLDVTP